MKKIISVFLSVVMLVSMCAGMEFSVQAADVSGYTAVSTKENFYNMRNKPNGKYYLADDIVFDSEDFIYKGDYYNNGNHWDSMGSFSGVLDGCGHTITGLLGDTAIAGVNSGTIKNLTIDNCELIYGVVCNGNSGTISNVIMSNCKCDATGLVYMNHGSMEYCISMESDGGIASYNYGTISNCVNYSDHSGSGIVNENDGTIQYCVNYGDVEGSGIAANDKSDAEIIECANYGSVAGNGIADNYYYYGTISNCFNAGVVSGYYGIGRADSALDCVNIGSVRGGKDDAIGDSGSSYYLIGSGSDGYGNTGLTAEQMKDKANFPTLNFKDTWQITEDGISLQCTNKKQIATVIYQYPAKTYYNVGEKLNVSDMMVMTCDNKGEWLITDDYTVSGFTGQLGKNVITVKAGDCSASFNVYVRDSISNSKITLNATKFTATGKAIKPTVKVISNSGKILKLNTDYTLTYSANTNPGTATVTITGKGLYTGSVKKTFTITPMQTKGIKVSTRKTTSLKLAWTKQSGVTGYEVQKYDSKKKKWANYKTITSNTNSVTASKLTAGVTYKFRVRSYKTIGKTKYYGAYSSTLTTPTTPPTVSVKSSKITTYNSGKSTYKISWKKCSNVSGYQIQVYGFGYDGSNWKNHWKTITTVKGAGKTSYTSKKRFDFEDGGSKIRIRTYKEVNGKKYYGAWKTPKTKHVYK